MSLLFDQFFRPSLFHHVAGLFITLACTSLTCEAQSPTNNNIPPINGPSPFHSISISGTTTNRLLVINKYPFYVNDEGNIMTQAGRQHLKVIDITDHSARVELDGQRQILLVTNMAQNNLTHGNISVGTDLNIQAPVDANRRISVPR